MNSFFPTVNIAADEFNSITVFGLDGFLSGNLAWNAIADVCVDVLERHDGATPTSVGDVIEADQVARRIAEEIVEQR